MILGIPMNLGQIKPYKHLFQIRERCSATILFEGVYEANKDDWYHARHGIANEYRNKIPKEIDWYVDSVLID